MDVFDTGFLKKLYIPSPNSSKGQNGRVTIIGGSKLFHGAPLFALTTASRIVDMVFFASPEPSVGAVADQVKSKLFSFIWVPWEETEDYIRKSDAVLIGSGMMRYKSEEEKTKGERLDNEGTKTKNITEDFLKKFPEKKWVIDAGSLQVLDPIWIPNMAILTPNKREYKMLFGELNPEKAAEKYNCVIVLKDQLARVCSPNNCIDVAGGNAGLTKGGTGDVQAGLTVALLTKNDPFLAASSAAFIVKEAADKLYEKVGTFYSADDLARKIPELLKQD
ncbi:MAG: NAD(P)H-hydrate dehydratase [Candidatus Microgenomates bacterium]|jgi:NAD(P)H-hydrate epimerase